MGRQEKDRYRQIIGAWGEDQAASFLLENGLQIVGRNYRTPDGEIDLIALEGNTVVFVEVKTRTNMNFGFPEESVTEEKLDHLSGADGTGNRAWTGLGDSSRPLGRTRNP